MPITPPTERMLRLEALAWWMVGYGAQNSLCSLWQRIGALAETNRAITLRTGQTVNEYLSERLGESLHHDSRKEAGIQSEIRTPFAEKNLDTYNLSPFPTF